MRFPSSEPNFAILRLADGRPIKVDVREASFLPDGVYEFNDVLVDLLRDAIKRDDRAALDRLWAAAHKHIQSGAAYPSDAVE